MKSLVKLLPILALIIFSCGKENENNSESPEEIITNSSYTFSLNEKESFEKELALKIKSTNGSSVKTYKTENSTTDRYDKIIYSDENGNDFIIESNITSDTLYIYQRDTNKSKTEEALRYIKVSESNEILEFVTINKDNSITTLNQYTLNRTTEKSSSSKTSSIARKTNTDIDDLESEINDTGEFLSDPTNTHPITAFYKGIVTNLFGDSNEDNVFDDGSTSILPSILDGIDSKRENILNNLGKIKNLINESKSNIKEFSQEQINKLIEEIEDDEEIDEEEIDDSILKDCKGVIDGVAVVDMCGDCVTSILETCEQDCNEDWGGNAFLDNCNDCVFGNTGKVECEQDCNGVYGGTAYLDDCNECVGGNTGNTECIIEENPFIGSWTAINFNGGNSMGEIQKSGFISECNVYTEQWTINSATADITKSNISVNISQKAGSSGYESSGGEVDCESISIEFDDVNFTINDTYTVKTNSTNADLNTEIDCEGEANNISTLTISGNKLIFKYCELTLTFEK